MKASARSQETASSNLQPQRLPLEILVVMLIAVAISLISSIWLAPTARAAACSSPHCFGAVQWAGTNIGASSTFKTVGLYSVNDGVNHISEEVWVIDNSHTCSIFSGSWLGIGEATWIGHTGNWYFWEECPPGGSANNLNFLYQPPSGNVGNYFRYYISGASGSSAWSLYMTDTAGNFQWSASTTSALKPDTIQTRLETTNNSYSVTHADAEDFINNQFKYAVDGTFRYQFVSGNNMSTYPPVWTWLVYPATGNNGGHGYVTCCP